jgi:DNA-binding NarL/FixJ family response regulator
MARAGLLSARALPFAVMGRWLIFQQVNERKSKAMSVKIILADDHDAIRQALRSILKADPDFEIAGEARNGREVIELVEQSQPDVVIMDISMPLMNGIEATRRLHQSHPEVKVMAFSSQATEAYVLGMFQAGATGYVLKPSSVAELRKAVRVILKGQVYVSPGLPGISIDEILRMDEKNTSP